MNMRSLNEGYLQIAAEGETATLSRRERDRLLREQDILKAAEHVFASKGFHKATIHDIAKEAEYATGTIYLYFKDKEALYLALFERKIQHLISFVKEKVGQTEGISDKLRVLVYEHLAYFQENQDFFRIYFSEQENARWTIKDKLPKSAIHNLLQYIEFISWLIQKAQEKSLIRKEFSPAYLAHALCSIVNTVIMRWLNKEPGKKEDLMDESAFVLDLFLNGAGKKK
jgi:AcrR family transcriptional regulator